MSKSIERRLAIQRTDKLEQIQTEFGEYYYTDQIHPVNHNLLYDTLGTDVPSIDVFNYILKHRLKIQEIYRAIDDD